MRKACSVLILLVLMAVCLSAFAEDNGDKSISLFVCGSVQDPDGINSYLEQVRSAVFPDLKSLEMRWLIPDEYSISQLLTWMCANENGVYILPRYEFYSLSSAGLLLPLEDDEELMASVENNDNITTGWRSVGDEMHLYGIPLAVLPGVNQFFSVENGFACAFAGDADPEDVKDLLCILCQDFIEQTE